MWCRVILNVCCMEIKNELIYIIQVQVEFTKIQFSAEGEFQ